MKAKITIAAMDEASEQIIMKLLKPILKYAKVRKTDKHSPFRHTYLTFSFEDKTTK